MRKVALVVPAYNEAARFDAGAFARLAASPELSLVFVDDGSTDETASRLADFCAHWPEASEWLSLPQNCGKAEAVRRGLLQALCGGAEIVGYTDADLATPPQEIHRLIEVFQAEDPDALLASRIRHLGMRIERSAHRHYLGRVFATAASMILGVPVYDTQCGAKLFRRTRALELAVSEPFLASWSFDVELLGRLLTGGPSVQGLAVTRIRELPLREWHHVRGSKIRPWHAFSVAWELARIAQDLRGRRRRAVSARRPPLAAGRRRRACGGVAIGWRGRGGA